MPSGKHILNIDLKRTGVFVQADPAANDDPHSLPRGERQPPGVLPEHDSFHTGGIIPQREVKMPTFIVVDKVGDFALDGNARQKRSLSSSDRT